MAEANVLVFAYTAVKALLEVFLIGLTGYMFAKNGTLTKPTLKSLSIISVNLLTPALLFSKMTETLDPGLLIELWNEPLFYFIYGGFSLLWSRFWTRTLRMDKSYGRFCDVATFFSNTNTLPVSLIKSIALSSGTQFLLKDADDTPLKVAARGVSYAMIFATLNNILRWSFGVALMGGVKTSRTDFGSVSTTPRTGGHSRTTSSGSPTLDMLRTFSRDCSVSNDDYEDDDENAPFFLGTSEPSRMRLVRALGMRISTAWATVRPCITPPVYAIVAAFAVILIAPLHAYLMDERSVAHTLWAAIDMCGDACVPLVLISLGGQLGLMSAQTRAQPVSAQATRVPSSVLPPGDGCGSAVELGRRPVVPPILLRTDTEAGGSTIDLASGARGDQDDGRIPLREQRMGAVVVLAGRFVFVPTLAVALVATLRGVFPRLLPIMAADPVYMLTLLILSGTPPAINLITVAQATGNFEQEAAQILFYGYVLGIFVLAIEVSGFLWLTNWLAAM
ncbi:hypothetical protein EV175_002505 [Coemansia sp. RSA 1933]|nr:hypothetical protein EV175_002505 [Coemansia sp. RSA 1933]